MRLPRFLWVPFELGRPFGAPHEPDFQRRVLHDALALIERDDGPVVLADFPDDAPISDDEAVWACPISFAPPDAEEPDLLASVHAEIGQLSPWAELGTAPAPNSGRPLAEIVELLHAVVHGGDADIEEIRLAADDARTWYLHAVAQQPGRATSHDRNRWFWRETALARMLGVMAAGLVDHPEPMVRLFADRGIVPRDHWDLLVPTASEGETR
ncbi:MAG: hypothetical protein AAF548_06960 [Actinomycetota bacterium]